jgi:hypothetical protein
MKDIAYIIKSHNELPYLRLMLWSLKYNNPTMWNASNIYVFANNCNDGTKQWCDHNGIWCKEVNFPGLYSLWNHAAQITNEHYIVFSASDFYLAPGFWKEISNTTEPTVHSHVTGTCIDNGVSYGHEDEPSRRWYKRDCGDNWQTFDETKFLQTIKELKTSDKITLNQTQYCPFITTREHYNFLNGFNTALGDYPTDIDHDFVRRGQEAGKQPCIVNNAFFYHFGKKSLLRRDNLEYDWKEIPNIW